jgi:hypothetical protein
MLVFLFAPLASLCLWTILLPGEADLDKCMNISFLFAGLGQGEPLAGY